MKRWEVFAICINSYHKRPTLRHSQQWTGGELIRWSKLCERGLRCRLCSIIVLSCVFLCNNFSRRSLGDSIYDGNIPVVWASMGLAVWGSNEPLSSIFSPSCFFSLLFVRNKKIYSHIELLGQKPSAAMTHRRRLQGRPSLGSLVTILVPYWFLRVLKDSGRFQKDLLRRFWKVPIDFICQTPTDIHG